MSGVTPGQLKSFVTRIESLEASKKEVQDDIKVVYNEAKSQGYDVKIIRKVISERKKREDERNEESELMDVYMKALQD